MGTFKVGDKVICVDASKHGWGHDLVKGETYTIESFGCCKRCGTATVILRGKAEMVDSHCGCGNMEACTRERYRLSRFEKPISLAACVEYKLKVSIPELVELKELQNQ